MSLTTTDALDSIERLAERAAALATGRRLISATVEIGAIDPCAAAFASRRADDRWFCWEEPDRNGFAIASLGTAHEVVSRGPGRVDDLRVDTTAITRRRLAEEADDLPQGAGPLWVGGMAFSATSPGTGPWASLPPALMTMPELLVARVGGRHLLTLCAMSGPGDDARSIRNRLDARVRSLRDAPLPPLDPSPSIPATVASARPPASYVAAVARAVELIRSSPIQKLVLAREVEVTAPAAHSPAALFGALRESFGSCFCFCVGTPEAAFVGASPELLVRRSGALAATVALAGSARRSADPAVDDHLGEQLRHSAKDLGEHAIVANRISRRLGRHAVWVEAAPDPVVIKVANIQHLATPIHAQLADSHSALALAGMLHPTPAVGSEPRGERGERLIAELEGMDRGWYAGPVGWMDAAEDGEFCVALRSALLRDRTAHLFAGAGIVADSDPAAELAETEIKLEA
ncbi:MAG: isochorismate synthase, partial [Actinomycetota bacterium]|nr:isochorismate synthase [Actinomycetota bacterium]